MTLWDGRGAVWACAYVGGRCCGSLKNGVVPRKRRPVLCDRCDRCYNAQTVLTHKREEKRDTSYSCRQEKKIATNETKFKPRGCPNKAQRRRWLAANLTDAGAAPHARAPCKSVLSAGSIACGENILAAEHLGAWFLESPRELPNHVSISPRNSQLTQHQ
jgi:hypothetical protein